MFYFAKIQPGSKGTAEFYLIIFAVSLLTELMKRDIIKLWKIKAFWKMEMIPNKLRRLPQVDTKHLQ